MLNDRFRGIVSRRRAVWVPFCAFWSSISTRRVELNVLHVRTEATLKTRTYPSLWETIRLPSRKDGAPFHTARGLQRGENGHGESFVLASPLEQHVQEHRDMERRLCSKYGALTGSKLNLEELRDRHSLVPGGKITKREEP